MPCTRSTACAVSRMSVVTPCRDGQRSVTIGDHPCRPGQNGNEFAITNPVTRVATLASGKAARPLVLRCVVQAAGLMAQGTFQSPAALTAGTPPMNIVTKLAGGFAAEELQYGSHSVGCNQDKANIQNFLRFCNIAQLNDPLNEHANNYPHTKTLLTNHWDALVRLTFVSINRFWPMNLHSVDFPDTQILSANAVSRIYQNSPLSAQEYADAELRAYYYSLQRGGGVEPTFDLALAQDDFARAAGDVLGATQ